MGARSMCTYVRTHDVSMIIDPSVALGPRRYNKPPHPIEIRAMSEMWDKIRKYAFSADVIIITHYHYDHHNPEYADLFKNKILLTKHPSENINKSQTKRAAYFFDSIKDIPSEIFYSDGDSFTFGGTRADFSKAVPHGINSKLGYVTEVCIDDGERFVYTSDVEGPSLPEQADFIIESDPDVLYCDGPMTYMLGFRYPQKNLDLSIGNLIRMIESTRVQKIVLDHHLLRDIRWRERMRTLIAYARASGTDVMTAAEFMGMPDLVYEARRSELYKNYPVTPISI
ncbi:hypothetical protein [Methanooceanicella nereidis]|nr:hypothetical protein [Methanocella sp. CWC-04]